MTLPRLPLVLALFALLFVAVMAGPLAVAPPAVRAANTEAQFDEGAARGRLARILGDEAPHPIDSERQDVTRTALLTEIRALGVEPEVRESFACRPNPSNPIIDCMMVRNIIFSIGPADGPAVLAATHYDSVPAGPGAGDAGIGMAVWLEVARHLVREQASLTRRVIFLITDGEEAALMGAHVFARDPQMADVQALINLEARGTRGPALFFETNQPNADAVIAFATAPRGMANSVMADVYQLLPNDTDVTELRRAGVDIVNIAISEGLENYHTPQDNLANLDARSVQHMGDIALSVARSFAGAADGGRTGTLVYTDILGGRSFVALPVAAGQGALAVIALIAFVGFWRAGAEGRWRTLAAPLVALVVAGALAFAVGYGFSLLRPAEDFWFAHPEAARAWCALIALAAIAASLLLTARNAAQNGAAGVFWFALIGFALTFVTPGISPLFLLPAAPYALGVLIAFLQPGAQRVGAVIAMIATVLIWAPVLALVEITLGFGMAYANATLVALMALPWLGALTQLQADGARRWPALALAAAAAGAVVIGALAPSYSPSRPMPLNVLYFYDASSNEARILTGTARRALPPSIAAAHAFTAERILPGDRQPSWAAPAALVPVPRPTLTDITARTQDGRHIISATLRMNGAYRAIVRIPRGADPIRAELLAPNGGTASAAFADTRARGDYFNLACQGRTCDGAQVLIELPAEAGAAEAAAAGADVDALLAGWVLIGQAPGVLPAPLQPALAARPAAATRIQSGDGVLTLERLGPAQAPEQN